MAFLVGRSSAPRTKRPSKELIDAIIEFKRRNPRVGCPRIAQEIARAFGIDIDKDIVRRVLAKHYRPEAGTDGPSWLSVIEHMKDSLWSVDLFRCESILLRSHWVMVVMDVFTRRIIGFGVERADPWRVGLSDVQPDHHRRKVAASAPEFRPRPTISFPSQEDPEPDEATAKPKQARRVGTSRSKLASQRLLVAPRKPKNRGPPQAGEVALV